MTWALSTPATCWHSEATNHSKCVLFRLPRLMLAVCVGKRFEPSLVETHRARDPRARVRVGPVVPSEDAALAALFIMFGEPVRGQCKRR